ncbi:MAG: sensor domain-containing diguanylate cyclase [Gammaproteobacteria bacterium]|nr:sensor domain-containing diguanylate cyclase [Gammaproteobacteria bacterium]
MLQAYINNSDTQLSAIRTAMIADADAQLQQALEPMLRAVCPYLTTIIYLDNATAILGHPQTLALDLLLINDRLLGQGSGSELLIQLKSMGISAAILGIAEDNAAASRLKAAGIHEYLDRSRIDIISLDTRIRLATMEAIIEKTLREENNIRDARAAIARISIDDQRYPTLKEKLQQAIEQITSLHEIGALPKGDYALLNSENADYLEIQGVTGFSDYIFNACQRIHIPTSNCLCAQAIRENRDIFSLHSNHNHYHGVQDPKRPAGVDHGHAIMVLRDDAGNPIGVQNLYIRSPFEECDHHRASQETDPHDIPRGVAFLDDCRKEVQVLISRFRAHVELERALKKQGELLQIVMRDHEIIQNMSASVVVFNHDGVIIAVNPAFCASTQHKEADILEDSGSFAETKAQLWQLFLKARAAPDGAYAELIDIRRKDGGIFKANLGMRRIILNHKKDEYICIFTDAAKAIEGLEELAFRDALTGLPNRLLFEDRLKQSHQEAARDLSLMAVYVLDASFLKWYNDVLGGHAAGDAMLREVALRIGHTIRSSDTVARVGGDEFGIILRDLDSELSLERINSDLINALNQPFLYNGAEVPIRAALGLCLFDGSADLTPAEIYSRADTAMYSAKFHGKGPVLMKKRDVTLHEIQHSHSQISRYVEGMQRPEVLQDTNDALRLIVKDELGVTTFVDLRAH